MTPADTSLDKIQELIVQIGSAPQHLIALLHAVQATYHYLPESALRELSRLTSISLADILGVATFYPQFRFKPVGRHVIKICVGTACHVKGAPQLTKDFKQHLHINDPDDTDPNQLFTVMEVACLGCCMLAPAVQIDSITYGPVQSQQIPSIIQDFLQTNSSPPAATSPPHLAHQGGRIKICLCSSCQAAGSKIIYDACQEIVHALHLPFLLKSVGCTGQSYRAPELTIETLSGQPIHYGLVKPEQLVEILTTHFQPQSWLRRLKNKWTLLLNTLLADHDPEQIIRYLEPVRLQAEDYQQDHQHLVATRYSGQLSPLSLDDYLAHQGFQALSTWQSASDPKVIIDLIRHSGLRGRGGGGYPTWKKWAAVAETTRQPKFLIGNADEGDPGAFMDRMLLESFPYRVLEGMAIAACACGIKQAYLFVRFEYPLAIERMRQALVSCQQRQLLGNLKIELVISAGAFVCGEETAMVAAIEGKRGRPHLRPPYPSEAGLWGQPTLINNVETLALIPGILLDEARTFRTLGTAGSPGTKTFALAGKIKQGGLIEVPMGTSLRTIVEEIGQGVTSKKSLKAVQIGGPAGGCLPARLLDTPIDFDALQASGSMMGSGGLIVLDQDDCMVELARYFMQFTQNESCGKCTFCRVGTKRLLEILEKLTTGQGQPHHLDQLAHLAQLVKQNSLCGLGRAAPNPILTGLTYFKDEFLAHTQGQCPAKRCRDLIVYRVTKKCIGCTKCAQHCPVDAIAPRPYQQQEINQDRCTKCDLCFQVCPQGAIKKENKK